MLPCTKSAVARPCYLKHNKENKLLLALHYSVNSYEHDNLMSHIRIFFFRKGACFNFRFFFLCKRDEVVMCQKYIHYPGNRRYVMVQNMLRVSQTQSYLLLLNQRQSLGHVRSTILRQAARFAMSTSDILL